MALNKYIILKQFNSYHCSNSCICCLGMDSGVAQGGRAEGLQCPRELVVSWWSGRKSETWVGHNTLIPF